MGEATFWGSGELGPEMASKRVMCTLGECIAVGFTDSYEGPNVFFLSGRLCAGGLAEWCEAGGATRGVPGGARRGVH